MRKILLALIILFTTTNAMAQLSSGRQVLIFGQPQSQQVKQQLAILEKEKAGVTERHIIIVLVPAGAPLYKEYKVAPSGPFTIVLVGKDGGEKYRSQQVTTAAVLFALIDAMPMRQAEMRNNKRRN